MLKIDKTADIAIKYVQQLKTRLKMLNHHVKPPQIDRSNLRILQ